MKLILSLPPTTNQQYGFNGNRRYLTPKSTAWQGETIWRIKTLNGRKLLKDKLRVEINFYLKFDRDLDNVKLLLDTLSGYIYKDDSQIYQLFSFKHKDAKNPRVELEITEL